MRHNDGGGDEEDEDEDVIARVPMRDGSLEIDWAWQLSVLWYGSVRAGENRGRRPPTR